MKLWLQILINVIIGLTTGIVSSWFTNVFLEKRYKKKLDFRSDVMYIYLTLCKYENTKIGTFGKETINNFLVETSVKLRGEARMSDAFEKVRGDIAAVLRMNNDNNLIISQGPNYLDLMGLLENYLKLSR